MPVVSLHGVTFAFADAAPILDRVDLAFDVGVTGLVGGNGAGKTTLLRLVSGELVPTAGHVVLTPGARVAHCPQTVVTVDARVRALTERDDRDVRRISARLGAPREAIHRWATLSPGERKRLQLAAAVLDQPDVLLLDEPQNHLDGDTRAVLRAVLDEAAGCVVLVSHDRTLLDACTTRTVRLDPGRVRVFPGPVSAAATQFAADERARRDERDARRAEAEKARRALGDARRTHASSERSLSRSARMKGPRDSDARGIMAQMRAERAEASLGRTVALRRAEAVRATERAAAIEVERVFGAAVFLGYAPCPRPVVLGHTGPLVVGGRTLAEGSFRLPRAGRVWLSGPNGAGKSSLVRAMLGPEPDPRIVHLPQTLGEGDGPLLLARLRGLPPRERGRVLSCVAALGVDPARLLVSANPSAGEARKLAIALGLGLHAWALVLDEPENHLDLPSVERLEAALGAYPGALLLVTHDEGLAARCTTERWVLGARPGSA